MRRWTLIFHNYIGYGSYIIEFKRVRSKAENLKRYERYGALHFIIPGWPPVAYPDGQAWDVIAKEPPCPKLRPRYALSWKRQYEHPNGG